jgi:hypothetical protein
MCLINPVALDQKRILMGRLVASGEDGNDITKSP